VHGLGEAAREGLPAGAHAAGTIAFMGFGEPLLHTCACFVRGREKLT
jgi:hypothetical protein